MKKAKKINRQFRFTQAQINNRFVDHWTFAEDFVENMLNGEGVPHPDVNVVINRRRLFLAVDSAYQDIARYKNYHQDNPRKDPLDCTKRCAYLIKWILKFKPLQIASENHLDADVENQEIDELELFNEMFALYLFELHLSDEINKDVVLSDDKLRQLAYDLLYRQISVDGWIAIFQLIKDCCFPKFVKQVNFLDTL